MQTIIIGIGNEHRGDDAVGVLIARRLAGSQLRIGCGIGQSICRIIEANGEGASLIESWQGYEQVILIDAVAPGPTTGPTGHIHCIDVRDHQLPSSFFHYSTHAFSLAEAVELARVLGLLPPAMIVYGIVGRSFGAGDVLSGQVAASAERLVVELAAILAPPAS